MLKNPLRPPPDMQHFLSDGGRIAIVDERKLNGEIRILGLPENYDTAGPELEMAVLVAGQLGCGREKLVRARTICFLDGDSCARFKWQPKSLARNAFWHGMGFQHCAVAGWPAPRLHQENVHTRRDAAGKSLSCPPRIHANAMTLEHWQQIRDVLEKARLMD
jgi:hypothetical protein